MESSPSKTRKLSSAPPRREYFSGDGPAGTKSLLDAIEMIPDEQKSSFLKATDRCPDLLESECDFKRFLRYTDYNFWEAAQNVVEYWEFRESLFGDRAFLPLTQTAALTRPDVMALQTGNYVLLRRTTNGEGVLLVDRSRTLPASTTESKLRACFYMIHHLSLEGDACNTMDCHVLVLLVTPRTVPMDSDFVRGAIKLLKVVPAKFKLHLLLCMPRTGATPLIQTIMATGLSFASTNVDGLEVHNKAIGTPILTELESRLGLTAADFPSSIGGTWKYQTHWLWCQSKLAEEEHRTTLPVPAKQHRKPQSESRPTDESKRERLKSLNVIHSRKKRERRKAELEELQTHCQTLSDEKKALETENARLQQLLVAALKAVEEAGQSSMSHGLSDYPALPPMARLKAPPLSSASPTMSSVAISVAHAIAESPVRNSDVASASTGPAAGPSTNLASAIDSLLNQPVGVQMLLASILEKKLEGEPGAAAVPGESWGRNSSTEPARGGTRTLDASSSQGQPDNRAINQLMSFFLLQKQK